MKKAISLFMVLVLMLTSLPVFVLAEESENTEYESLIALACQTFPEYTDTILGNSKNNRISRATVGKEIVRSETRAISSSHYLTYNEYSDGCVVVLDLLNNDGDDFTYSTTTNRYSTGSGGKTTDITIKAVYAGEYAHSNTYFELKNVIYTTVSGGYGVINSAGTANPVGDCRVKEGSPTVVYQETASSAARIVYQLVFHIGDSSTDFFVSTLTFSLKNNSVAISHVG